MVVKVASNAERKDICHGTALKVSFSYRACADVDCDLHQIKQKIMLEKKKVLGSKNKRSL